ncbi:hypothetical protein CIRG_10016 [Coccidioides immitis RMSCC 2394]|uniref:C2H2-type domain-containing protein n=1 Tax=Coccidioides immitis RMSCC 2394 TaxID=404692 RepID=A0A0J6Y691_COCIT|nr:hypothetical protein CIRG_10016 [Coccidioides immitis RMSCC 2394]
MSSADNETSFYETYDTMHVREKFPDASQFLVYRLGRAISWRRQYLKYRESHHKELSHGIHPDHDAEQDSLTEIARQSTAAFALPNVEGIDLSNFQTMLAQKLRAPLLPLQHLLIQSNCVHRHYLKKRRMASHSSALYLPPVTIILGDCATPDRLFAHRNEWFEHEKQVHMRNWECIECSHKAFTSESAFREHLRQMSPVQQEIALYLQFRRHLAKHQKQLALFALPSNVQQDNDDGDNGIPKPEALDIGAQGYSDDAGPDTVTEDSNSDSDTEIYAIRCAGIRLPIVATSAVDMDD